MHNMGELSPIVGFGTLDKVQEVYFLFF